MYMDFAEDFMAIPVVKESKRKERFAGAEKLIALKH
jgi:hypothetical protein